MPAGNALSIGELHLSFWQAHLVPWSVPIACRLLCGAAQTRVHNLCAWLLIGVQGALRAQGRCDAWQHIATRQLPRAVE